MQMLQSVTLNIAVVCICVDELAWMSHGCGSVCVSVDVAVCVGLDVVVCV